MQSPSISLTSARRNAGRRRARRARGGAAAGRSRRIDTREAGSLRVRFPGAGANLEAVIINTAGGVAGGDRYDLDVAVGADARLAVTTAAAEKIYRSLGADTHDRVSGCGWRRAARSHWLPQETILFDRARLSRSIDIELAAGAALLVAETLVFGRAAMGEAVEQGACATAGACASVAG